MSCTGEPSGATFLPSFTKALEEDEAALSCRPPSCGTLDSHSFGAIAPNLGSCSVGVNNGRKSALLGLFGFLFLLAERCVTVDLGYGRLVI